MADSRCRYCGGPIRWALTTNDQKIALMMSPDVDGRYQFIGPGLVRALTERDARAARAVAEVEGRLPALFLPHVVECSAQKPDPYVPQDVMERAVAVAKRGSRRGRFKREG